jgi:hypothetical protein
MIQIILITKNHPLIKTNRCNRTVILKPILELPLKIVNPLSIRVNIIEISVNKMTEFYRLLKHFICCVYITK